MPDSFKQNYEGPKFGVKGSKRSCSVVARPMIGTIIKPSIGLSVEETANLVDSLIEAGVITSYSIHYTKLYDLGLKVLA